MVGIYDPQHIVDWLVPGRELFLALHVLGVACFIYIVSKRLVPLLRAHSDPRFDRPLVRLGRVFKFWLGIPKPRADWRHRRWTAKHAVAACINLPDEPSTFADIEIRAASSGAPGVFLQDRQAEIAISLSHSSGTALCTLAPPEISFGCDLETVEPRSDAFVADYFTVDEESLIAQSPPQERPFLLALLWSAKESALKALRVGLRFDTRCMSVSPVDDWHPTGNPNAWRSLRVRYSGGRVFHGGWRLQDHLVRTVVSDLPLPMPVPARAADLSMA